MDSEVPERNQTIVRRRVTPRRVTLESGHRVGVSVAGTHGVPFVFLHGIGLNTRAYRRCLSYLPDLGFLAIGIDAPGHGDTDRLGKDASFEERVAVISQTLDHLGVRRAVIAGHSMGGRSVACLLANEPQRFLAALFVDAALGLEWDDASAARIDSRVATARALTDAVVDTFRDGRHLDRLQRRRYRDSVFSRYAVGRTALTRLPGLARSIAVRSTGDWLERGANHAVPAAVVQGARDMVVPIEDARAVARVLKAPMVVLPEAFHSWLLASPSSFHGVVRDLFTPGSHLAAALPKDVDDCFAPRAKIRRFGHPDLVGMGGAPDAPLYEWDYVEIDQV